MHTLNFIGCELYLKKKNPNFESTILVALQYAMTKYTENLVTMGQKLRSLMISFTALLHFTCLSLYSISKSRHFSIFKGNQDYQSNDKLPLGQMFFDDLYEVQVLGFPGGSDGKESNCNSGDLGSIPGSGRFPGEGNGYPLQYSCLENSKDRGTWWATVHGVTKGQTRLSD